MANRKLAVIGAAMVVVAVSGASFYSSLKNHSVAKTSVLQHVTPADSKSDSLPARFTRDLGLLVLDSSKTFSVDFDLPAGMPRPDSVVVGKSCCTDFLPNSKWEAKPGGVMTIRAGPNDGSFIWTAQGWNVGSNK